MKSKKSPPISLTLEDNLKKAVTELLILHLLNTDEYYIGELTAALKAHSKGVLKLVFPYSAIYRLQRDKYISDTEKRIAPDGRLRQFFSITPSGRDYYKELLDSYHYFINGINVFLDTTFDPTQLRQKASPFAEE